MDRPNGIPRRAFVPQMIEAERKILEAMRAVEAVGCAEILTDAVVLLQAARDSVADFVDGTNPAPRRRVVVDA